MKMIILTKEIEEGDYILSVYFHSGYQSINLPGAYSWELTYKGEFIDSHWGFLTEAEATQVGKEYLKTEISEVTNQVA